jgi:SAM-dependent methyltransferase
MSLIEEIDYYFYAHYSKNWDDKLFREILLKRINQESIILDLGAGAGIVEEMNFKGYGRKVCGVDLDNRVVDNPYLDEGRVADASGIPYPDQTFDIVFSDNVLEHLDKPIEVFREVYRVLKPGGVYLVKTPNKWHYVTLISRCTPHWFHEYVNRLRGRKDSDTFPTVYKANSRRDIKQLCKITGFEVEDLKLIEGRPEYLRIFVPTYLIGIVYERLVNSLSFLSTFRVLLVGSFKKVN